MLNVLSGPERSAGSERGMETYRTDTGDGVRIVGEVPTEQPVCPIDSIGIRVA